MSKARDELHTAGVAALTKVWEDTPLGSEPTIGSEVNAVLNAVFALRPDLVDGELPTSKIEYRQGLLP